MSLPLSVIVCTHNRARLLADCLESLIDQSLDPGEYEIVVVNDGSTDDTAQVVQAIRADSAVQIQYIERPHSGVNATRNAGIRSAVGLVISFCDDDQLAPHDYLAGVLAVMTADDSLSGIGGPVMDYGASGVHLCDECSWSSDQTSEEPHLVSGLLGGNMAIRRAVFDSVGLFDEGLSGYGDETEWFNRASGLRLEMRPELWLWHRRDWIGWWGITTMAFEQGRTIPRATGFNANYRGLFGNLRHAIRRRCGRGWWRFCRSLGAHLELLRMKLTASSRRPTSGKAPDPTRDAPSDR
jgi:glycosyltransferase involved in cell wall biosynthesis